MPTAIQEAPQRDLTENISVPAGDPVQNLVEHLFTLPEGAQASPLAQGLDAAITTSQETFSLLEHVLKMKEEGQNLPRSAQIFLSKLGGLAEGKAQQKIAIAKADATFDVTGPDEQEQILKTAQIVELLVTRLLPEQQPDPFTPPADITDPKVQAYLEHAHNMAFYTAHLDAAFAALEAFATASQIDPSQLTHAVVAKMAKEIGLPGAQDQQSASATLKERLFAAIRRTNEMIQLRPENALVLQQVLAAQSEMQADQEKHNSLIKYVEDLFKDGNENLDILRKVRSMGRTDIVAHNVSEPPNPIVLTTELSQDREVDKDAAFPKEQLQFIARALSLGYTLDAEFMMQPLDIHEANVSSPQMTHIAQVNALLQRVEQLVKGVNNTQDAHPEYLQQIRDLVTADSQTPPTDTQPTASELLTKLQTSLQQARSQLKRENRTLTVIEEAKRQGAIETLPPSQFPMEKLINALETTPRYRWRFWLRNNAVGQATIEGLPDVRIAKGVNVIKALSLLQIAQKAIKAGTPPSKDVNKFIEQTQRGKYQAIEITGGDTPEAHFTYFNGEIITIPLEQPQIPQSNTI